MLTETTLVMIENVVVDYKLAKLDVDKVYCKTLDTMYSSDHDMGRQFLT